MGKKKGKGRGRGRGRGQTSEGSQEVGQKAASQEANGSVTQEPKAPGARPRVTPVPTVQTTGLPPETPQDVPRTDLEQHSTPKHDSQSKHINEAMSGLSITTSSSDQYTQPQVRHGTPQEQRTVSEQAQSLSPHRQPQSSQGQAQLPQQQVQPSQGQAQPPHVQRQVQPPQGQAQPPHVQRQVQPPQGQAQPPHVQRQAQPPQGQAQPPHVQRQAQPPQGQAQTPQGQGKARRNQRTPPKEVLASSMTDDRSRQHQEVALLPHRPDFGREGRPIKLKANSYKLDLHHLGYLFHYDIDIKPEKTPIGECREVVKKAVDKYLKSVFEGHKPAFDGRKNLYSKKKLPAVDGEGQQFEIVLPGIDGGKDRKFKLTIKYAAQVCVKDLQKFLEGTLNGKLPQEVVQALDVILRQIPSLHFTPIGRSFFPSPDGHAADLGGGCEMWTGFYQSIRPSQWKTMLVNIDVSSKGFQKQQPVIDFLWETLAPNFRDFRESNLTDRKWQMPPAMRKEFLTAIKGLRIETNHIPGMKRKYLVTNLGKSASTNYFSLQDEGASKPRQVSVEQYFLEKYRIQLQYPHLPCLIVGQKNNSLPMEVCSTVPSAKRKLTDKQTAEMIKKTARPAYERQKKISEWAEQLESKSHSYLANEFGMSINKSMVDVDGRVLSAPAVKLGDSGKVVPQDGVWDMRGKKFFNGANVQVWAMVCFENPRKCDENVTRNFANAMNRVCQSEGMRMNREPCKLQYARHTDNIERLLSDLVVRYQNLQLILVVLPSQGNKEIYKEVKRVGDTVLGIPTQCVQTKQFMGAKPQVCSNIAMKINAKLGGINHIVDPHMMPELFRDVIVFGADVTHPTPGEKEIPSIAAVVASMDSHASKYAARVRAQTHIKDKAAQEIILDMAAMVRELLVEFYRQTKTKPKRIIFYRDGVSEGQFDQVLLSEVKAVQQACLNIQKDGQYQPPITFVVVQKRHHTRLFCADRNDQSGKAGNIPAGTTVDRGITHPFEFDFYLCSHHGIQGTSRPTHYHVLYDDNQFSADGLQKLTYHLCHTYARCTRSVSMPSPAYYAHLVAFRARHHLNGLIGLRQDGRKSEEEIMREFCEAINVSEKVKGGMYFA